MGQRVVTEKLPNPAAGADFSFIPAAGDNVRLLSLSGILTTAVAAANRIAALQFKTQSGDIYWSADAVVPQTASLAVRYSWAIGTGLGVATAIVTGERVALPLPHLWLGPQDTVGSITGAIAVADQWSGIVARYLVGDEWMDEVDMAAFVHAFTAVRG